MREGRRLKAYKEQENGQKEKWKNRERQFTGLQRRNGEEYRNAAKNRKVAAGSRRTYTASTPAHPPPPITYLHLPLHALPPNAPCHLPRHPCPMPCLLEHLPVSQSARTHNVSWMMIRALEGDVFMGEG